MAVRNKLYVAYGVVDVLLALTGALFMAFALISKSFLHSTPTVKNVAQDLLLDHCPLDAAVVNAVFILITFAITVPVLLKPTSRGWLRFQGWAVVFCATFTLVLGLVIWFDTLEMRAHLGVMWARQDPTRQSLLQQKFDCCGYLNATSPQFVTDSTCANALDAVQKQGCAGPFAEFANGYLDLIFTAAFGVVGLDVIMLLCVVMLIKRREELERYRHIDEKTSFGGL